MKINSNVRRIYIQLDALLDTRLGALWELDPELCDRVIANGYHGRVIDNYSMLVPEINHAAWLERYTNRTAETLVNSRLTSVNAVLDGMLRSMEAELITSPNVDGLEVVVNTHPYELSDAETEALKDCVQTFTGTLVGIRTISQPNVSLTFAQIKQSFDIVFMYDFHEWISKVNPDDMTANKVPGVKLIVPALYEKEIPAERDLRLYNGNQDGPFAELELSLQEFISLHYWDAGMFSVLIPEIRHKEQS